MNILICSVFAMSLIVFPLKAQEVLLEDLAGFEFEILPELTGPQRFTAPDLHQQADWQVKKSVIKDRPPLKGQDHSLIPWSSLDPEQWLSVEQWLIENEIKTKHPDWQIRLRDDRHLELIGKVMSCKGKCPIYRGTMPASGQYLSRLLEGDEIRTEVDSVAWIFLMDGTLVRLGPESSLSLQEINIGKSEIFILARLNHGHVFWHGRDDEKFPIELAPETDALNLPLQILKANIQHFERKIFQAQNDQQQLSEIMDLDENAIKAQIQQINELRENRPKLSSMSSKAMLVAPNITVVSNQVSLDLVHITGGKSYFKRRQFSEKAELFIQMRGYAQTETFSVNDDEWYEVAPAGRSFMKVAKVPATLQLMELLTNRIKTIELGREIWISQFTLPILSVLESSKLLAFEYGYTLWDDKKSKLRFEFLTEYTRRIETTNIRSISNLLSKIEKSGGEVKHDLTVGFYQHALNHYLKGLKTRYTSEQMQVREMNDLQYYVWTLKNGKL
jgi:hypothetical protein